tara:strand:- start:210 stop:332 length:123 start_codon:yes stop_codon:yes gene_type:complete
MIKPPFNLSGEPLQAGRIAVEKDTAMNCTAHVAQKIRGTT